MPTQADRQWRAWEDEDDGADGYGKAAFKRLSREEARALGATQASISPWWVVAAQVVVGLLVAFVAWLVSGRAAGVASSAVFGAAVVVVPGALMARGMTSRLSVIAPAAAAVSFAIWEFLKIAVSVLMLALAPKVLQPLVWPALLAALVVCIKVYWVALLWRGVKKR